MKELDLIKTFHNKRLKEQTPSDVEDLRQFFAERHISNYKIAEVLKRKPQQVGYWFNGQQPTPAKWRTELETLRQMFIDWEDRHGFLFNSKYLYQDEYNVKNLVCPFDTEGTDIKFGRDFDVYQECADCDIKSDCEEFHSKYAFPNEPITEEIIND